jgi:hypothetical protein
VPLLFYLFDRLAERGKDEGPPAAAERAGAGGILPAAAPHEARRDG